LAEASCWPIRSAWADHHADCVSRRLRPARFPSVHTSQMSLPALTAFTNLCQELNALRAVMSATEADVTLVSERLSKLDELWQADDFDEAIGNRAFDAAKILSCVIDSELSLNGSMIMPNAIVRTLDMPSSVAHLDPMTEANLLIDPTETTDVVRTLPTLERYVEDNRPEELELTYLKLARADLCRASRRPSSSVHPAGLPSTQATRD
jgi:hypothetical protein